MATETNVERLEQFKQYRSNFLLLVAAGVLNKKIISDFDLLFEQAERAQELEKSLTAECESRQKAERDVKYITDIHSTLEKENASLRQALEKIAASGLDCFENECTYIACEALAGETNGQRKA